MHAKQSDLPRHTRPSILAADRPLVVPMLLRISDLKLRGIVVLVVSKTKGITLVFKNDPLESILVSSTFDSVTSVRNFLQREIEKQLRNLFQEDLPVMIHNLSLRHLQSEQEKAKKQQQEERLKREHLRKLEKRRQRRRRQGAQSVFSDPGTRGVNANMARSAATTPTTAVPTEASPRFDTLSMPDLPPPPPLHLLSSASSDFLDQGTLGFSTFSDLYNNERMNAFLEQQSASASTTPTTTAPVTAANLSTLNELYSKRFAAMQQDRHSLFSDLHHQLEQHAREHAPAEFHDDDDLDDDFDDDFDDDGYDEEDVTSSLNESSSLAASIADIYADDVDAPWYVTEGPGLPSSTEAVQPLIMPLDQEVVVDPSENALAAKLAQLTCHNRTISPFAYTIDHATFRSLPHQGKKVGPIPRQHKKIPKRRVIRLQMNNKPSSSSSATPA